MTRDANLYYVKNQDWKPLAATIENNADPLLKNDVTIYQLMTSSSEFQHYAIVSLSDKADKIIENYGATPAVEKDYLRITLHDYSGEPLYGDKSNVTFLKKFS